MDINGKKLAVSAVASLAAATSLASPAFADGTAVTADEQASGTMEQAAGAVGATDVATAKQVFMVK